MISKMKWGTDGEEMRTLTRLQESAKKTKEVKRALATRDSHRLWCDRSSVLLPQATIFEAKVQEAQREYDLLQGCRAYIDFRF